MIPIPTAKVKLPVILDTLLHRLTQNYTLSAVCLNFILLLLTVAKKFEFNTFENQIKDLASLVLFRVIAMLGFGSLHILCRHCRITKLLLLIYIIGPALTFETTYYFLTYYDAYMNYIMFYNSFREIVILNSQTKVAIISEFLNIAHQITRAIIFKYRIPNYSIYAFLTYLLAFIAINEPLLQNHISLKNIIANSDKLKNDFENVVYSLPIPIFQLRENPQSIILSNTEFAKFLSANNLIDGVHFMNLINTRFPTFLTSSPIESNNIILNLNKKDYSIAIRKLEQSNNELFIACIEDISIYKEIESLKAKEAYKKMYISVVNHHLRTPLNGIYGPLVLLKEKIEGDDKQLLELAIGSLNILNALVNDTIAFSECEQGKMKIRAQRVNIPKEIQKLGKMFSFESKQKEISFEIKLDVKCNTVIIDIDKITQILIILLSNAFKYTFKGGIVLKCQQLPNMKLSIEVEDSGIGINEQLLPTVFDEFQSVDLINAEKMTCAGFQLALVKKLVTIMNGAISVESHVGKGTKFKIELPVEWVRLRSMQTCEFINQQIDIPIVETRLPIMPDKIIEVNPSNLNLALVVDDNATNVFVLQKMLKLLGVESEKAMNGRECIDKVQLASYSIILMDINMPVMNGIDASKELMKMYLEKKIVMCPPIIAVTAQEGFEIVEKCESIGIRKCIPKPVKKSELSEILKELGIIKA